MKTTLKIVAVLLAGLVTLPAAIGVFARPAFDTLVQDIERRHSSIGDVARETTRHGWFQTQRRVSVEVRDPSMRTLLAGFLDGAQSDAPLLLDLDIALRHGPLPLAAGSDGALSPALGNTRLTWQVRQGSSSTALPVSVLVRSGPRRTKWTVAVAPHQYASGDGDGTRLVHSGARLDGVMVNDAATLECHGSLGDLVVALPDGRRFDALGGQLDLTLANASAQSTLRFESLRSAGGAGSSGPVSVAGITWSSEFAVAAQRLTSTNEIGVGEIRIADATQSSSAHGTLHYAADAQATALLARFVGALATGAAIDTGPSLFGALASRGVALAVPAFNVTTPDGLLEARMDAELPAGDGDARDMLLRSTGTARMSIPVTLLRRIMASSADIEASLQYALQSGLVRRQGQAYVSDWRLRGGSLRINGRPVPLPL